MIVEETIAVGVYRVATEHRRVKDGGRAVCLEQSVPRVRVIRIGIKSEKLRSTLTGLSHIDFQYAAGVPPVCRRPGDIDRLIETMNTQFDLRWDREPS